MNARASLTVKAYPGKVAIRHVIDAARACGLDVAGVEVSTDGTIRVVEARVAPQQSLFDRLEKQGKI